MSADRFKIQDPHVPVAILDLDGVLTVSPSSESIKDVSFFHGIWSDPSALADNPEMLILAQALLSSGWAIVILTGRPSEYRDPTRRWLQSRGILCAPEPFDESPLMIGPGNPVLITRDLGRGDEISSASSWKLGMIRNLKAAGARVLFILEDYKPNADVLRSEAPVLLYEMVKPNGSLGR